jgi:hypothetical protein
MFCINSLYSLIADRVTAGHSIGKGLLPKSIQKMKELQIFFNKSKRLSTENFVLVEIVSE